MKIGGTSVAQATPFMKALPTLLAGCAASALALVSNRSLAQDADPAASNPDEWFEEEEEPEPTADPEPGADTEPPYSEDQPPATQPDPFPGETQKRVEEKRRNPKSKKRTRARFPPPGLEDPGRFRGGVGAIFAGARYNDDEDFVFLSGIEARFGGQLDDTFGVYATPSILVSDTVRLATGVALDLTLGDVFSLGGGVEGIIGSLEEWGQWTPGASLTARSGFHMGKYMPNRRKVFSLEAIAKVDFYFDDTKVLILGAALGYDAM